MINYRNIKLRYSKDEYYITRGWIYRKKMSLIDGSFSRNNTWDTCKNYHIVKWAYDKYTDII